MRLSHMHAIAMLVRKNRFYILPYLENRFRMKNMNFRQECNYKTSAFLRTNAIDVHMVADYSSYCQGHWPKISKGGEAIERPNKPPKSTICPFDQWWVGGKLGMHPILTSSVCCITVKSPT